ncbi:MAG: hypothetical protein AAFQ19_00800 [Pseudomonadota bacterium]
MKKTFLIPALLAAFATPAFAQDVVQSSIVGPSDDPVYTLRITGTDGQAYDCLPETETRDGREFRICGESQNQLLGGDLGVGAVALAGVVGIILIGSSSSTTTSTP